MNENWATRYRRPATRALSVVVSIAVAASGLSVPAYAGDAPPSAAQTPATADAPPTGTGQSQGSSADRVAQENMFWDSAQRSNTMADYKAYLDAFPNGVYAPLARNRIAAMSGGGDAQSGPPAATQTSVQPAPAVLQPPAQPAAQAASPTPVSPVMPQAALPPAAAPAPNFPSVFGPLPAPVSAEALKAEIGTVETEAALVYSPEQRMELQMRLQALGLYLGPIDGDLGPGARGAIVEWQRRNGVAPTGELGPLQLATLMLQSEAPFQQYMLSRQSPVVVRPVYRPVRVIDEGPDVGTALGVIGLGLLGGALLGGGFGGHGGHHGGFGGARGGAGKHSAVKRPR